MPCSGGRRLPLRDLQVDAAERRAQVLPHDGRGAFGSADGDKCDKREEALFCLYCFGRVFGFWLSFWRAVMPLQVPGRHGCLSGFDCLCGEGCFVSVSRFSRDCPVPVCHEAIMFGPKFAV